MGICPNYDTVVLIVSFLYFPHKPLFLLFVILQVYLLALHFTPRFYSEKRGGGVRYTVTTYRITGDTLYRITQADYSTLIILVVTLFLS